MESILIENGSVITGGGIKRTNLLLRGGIIAEIGVIGELPPDTQIIDARGLYVSPGFIDLHLHGGGGYDFMDCTEEALSAISRTHLEYGTTTLYPTAVSSEFSELLRLIDTYKRVKEDCPNFYGIHLEGPYISKNQKGAHKEHLLHAPTKEETDQLLSVGAGVIRRITAAPELEGMAEFARVMVDHGVHMAIGHSDATSDVALCAMKNGFSHVTHLYSATPTVRKINEVVRAGVIEAAYLDDDVTVELIADGKHAAVDALRLAVKIKGKDKVCLVTDALRPAGTDVKESYLGAKTSENRVIIEDGVAKLPDRSSFAGSIATGATLLQKGVQHYGFSVLDTVTMMTETPASVMHLAEKGRIDVGYDADVVIFDEKCRLSHVIAAGHVVK